MNRTALKILTLVRRYSLSCSWVENSLCNMWLWLELSDVTVQYFRNSLRPMSSQSRMSNQRAMQSGNTGTGVGTSRSANARLGATNTTLSSTGASDWSTSVDSRPPRGTSSKTAGRTTQSNTQQRTHNTSNKQQVSYPFHHLTMLLISVIVIITEINYMARWWFYQL